jgi:hypothetical protein
MAEIPAVPPRAEARVSISQIGCVGAFAIQVLADLAKRNRALRAIVLSNRIFQRIEFGGACNGANPAKDPEVDR